MCDNVIIHGHEVKTVMTQGELAEIIGRINVVMGEEGVSPLGGIFDAIEFCVTDCLCPVDLPASAKRAGYDQTRLDVEGCFDPFDNHWRSGDHPTRDTNTAEGG